MNRKHLIIGLLAMAVLLAPVAVPSKAQAADTTQTMDVEAADSGGISEDCGNITCTVIFSRNTTKQLVAPSGIAAAISGWLGPIGRIMAPVTGSIAAAAGRAVMIGRCLKIKVASVKWVLVGPVVGIGTDNGSRCHN